MPWINPEEFKNSPEMHNIPFASLQCNGLGMGGMHEVIMEGKFSPLGLFPCCATENVGVCSELPCFAAQGAGEKKELYLNYLIVTRSSRTKGKTYLEGNVSSRAQTAL